jgi:hypothetical protein
MRHKIITRAFPLLLAASSLLSLRVFAQDPAAPSVAEAARRAREQKQNSGKTAKVITDDTLHPQSANTQDSTGASQSNQNPNGSAASDSTAANATAPAVQPNAASSSEKDEEKKKELESLKQEIAEKQNDVDLAQRELALASDNYYSKPDFSNDKAGKAQLDNMQTDLNAKKDDLAKLKSKFADLGGVEEAKPQAPPATLVPPRPR